MTRDRVGNMTALRTMVVDDNKSFRDVLVEYLKTMNEIDVVGQADNGLEAFLKAQILQPDLILMDISMNEMDGFKAASMIKDKIPNIRIIFITIHKAETYRYIAALLQADGYVWKNSMMEDLPIKIQRIRDSLMKTSTLTRTHPITNLN